MSSGPPLAADERLAMARRRWDGFAVRFTETANKRVTRQCAAEMHAHMRLEEATNVLEVGAGAGIGSLDVIEHLKRSTPADAKAQYPQEPPPKKTFLVTDLAPKMVQLARDNLRHSNDETLDVQIAEANGQALTDVADASMDRYIACLCLQLCPDPDALLREARRVLRADGIAGFTIWGRPEFSGKFTIDSALCKELGQTDGEEHSNFAYGKDLDRVRAAFAAAGFTKVMIWPYLCVLELWSGEEFAKFHRDTFWVEDVELRARRFEVAKRLGDEWLTKGFPIGLETQIIIARP